MKMDYKNYRRTYEDFKRTVNLTLGRSADEEFEQFCLGAVFRAWGSNRMLYSPAYREILADVFGKEYTAEEIAASMKACADPEKKIAVPAFFREIVDMDRARKTDNARNMVTAIYELLAFLALLNGDFTIEEASAIDGVIGILQSYAEEKGVMHGEKIPETPANITPLRDSYSSVVLAGADSLLQFPESLSGEENPAMGHTLKDTEDLLSFLAGTETEGQPGTGNAAGLNDYAPGKTIGSSGQPETVVEAEVLPERSEEKFNELMDELNGLVGLSKVKEDIRTLLNFIKVNKMREERGMKKPKISYHLVFTGNPGTGKTTVARLVAGLYYQMGILPKGQLVEADRSSLVAGYLGQTAIKTQEVIQRAMGGVLFIDEAYALANDEQDTYGKEAIETILKAMEDHRDELVVIVAGYTELMHRFINSNPGLNSRFNKYFLFPDYTGPELKGIFDVYCKKNGYKISDETAEQLEKKFTELYENRNENFGNGRDVRNIFEKAINHQANRLAEQEKVSDDDLQMITMEDIDRALEQEKDRPSDMPEEPDLESMLKALKSSVEKTDESC